RRPNPLQVGRVLGRGSESETVTERRRWDRGDGAHGRLVDRTAGCGRILLLPDREVLVEVPADVLRKQQANVECVAPQLAVRERSLLEGSQRLHALVGLAEQ